MAGPGDGCRKAERCGKREPTGQWEAVIGQASGENDREPGANSDTSPNCVSFSTDVSTPDITASRSGSPLIDIVSNSTQISPEITVTAKPIQATRSAWVRNGFAAASCKRKAGLATTARNNSIPVTVAVAAKWIARVAIMAPLIRRAEIHPPALDAYWPT